MPLDPADFSVAWDTPRKGIVWATVTHDPSGRSFRLKASKPVTDAWQAAPDPAAARTAWVKARAIVYLEYHLYQESAEGIRERLIKEAKRHRDAVVQAKQFCDDLKATYPAHASRIPTITLVWGED